MKPTKKEIESGKKVFDDWMASGGSNMVDRIAQALADYKQEFAAHFVIRKIHQSEITKGMVWFCSGDSCYEAFLPEKYGES